ncbi:MAG: hypothetical protein HYX87_00220 [Chloroflexi bacterium]|nr:hypothetical protein [Chloroflexota bacterium]
MSHRVRLKGTRSNRGTHSKKRTEHRLPWEEDMKKLTAGQEPKEKAAK